MEDDLNIAVNNAGLIILGAYLPQYFERLELTENGAFKDEDAQNRSVYLLQYLVYNRIDFAANYLLLNKLLVGMSIDAPLTRIEKVSQDEKELSASLLQGVIHNWDSMQNSTSEAIQESFFKHDGLLQFKEEHIELTVEKRSIDILLQRISWNISLVKIPWMDRPLHISWY